MTFSFDDIAALLEDHKLIVRKTGNTRSNVGKHPTLVLMEQLNALAEKKAAKKREKTS